MNRLAGIVVAVLGFVVAVLSILKVVPGLTQTGVVMILFGGLIIGLSFISKPESDGTERMSTPSTLGNIFISPSEVFRNLRRHPRWLVAMLVMSILSATYSNLFVHQLTAERVTNFSIDKTSEIQWMTDDARKGIEAGRASAIAEAKSPIGRAGQAVSGFAASVFGYAILAGIFMLFALAIGGKLNFWQGFSAAIYAVFPLSIIRFVLNTTILFLKDPSDIHPVLGQQSLIQDNLSFLVIPSEHPVIFTLLGSLSLLLFYWIWMNATGLKNAGERVSGSIAWTATLTMYGVLLCVGVIMAFLFPGFIS